MVLDYDFMSGILTAFIESSSPIVSTELLINQFPDDEQKLAHHLIIMTEKKLIIGAFEHRKIGIELDGDEYYFISMPLRLTSDGYDFSAALNKPSILNVIKEKLQNEGISSVIEIAKKMTEKQLNNLLDD